MPADRTLWGHRWGFRDTRFVARADLSVSVTGERYPISGTEMPEFLPYVAKTLGIRIDVGAALREKDPKPVPPPRPHPGFLEALAAAFAPDRYTQEPAERLLHSHGQTTAEEVYAVLYDRLERVADLVFYPQEEQEAVDLVALARAHGVCLVPYGGGSSVSCALQLSPREERFIVSVDTRRLKRILWIDRLNLRACVEAGITGSELESALAREGFTCGHEPDSVEISTLGGWIATHASGMKKNRYGNIEEIVESLRLITPAGRLEQMPVQPRVSIGMQPQSLVFGSEGNLGLITQAVVRLHPLPETRRFGSLVFPDFKAGLAFLEQVERSGLRPASLRLVDNGQFGWSMALRARSGLWGRLKHVLQNWALHRVVGFDPTRMCAATLLLEGARADVARQAKEIRRLAGLWGGIDGGEANGRRGYMLTFAIAYIRDFLAEFQIMGETFETTVAWSQVDAVIEAVNRCGRAEHERHGLPGRPYLSVRVTQTYHSGVCLYFTHGYSVQGIERPGPLAASIERAIREAILAAGGSLSHHHGVGKLRAAYLEQALTPPAREALRAFKSANDPDNIFGAGNGVFGLDV